MKEKIIGVINTYAASYDQASEILALFKEEIEKVENPYSSVSLELLPICPPGQSNIGFERCRQKILSLLKE